MQINCLMWACCYFLFAGECIVRDIQTFMLSDSGIKMRI